MRVVVIGAGVAGSYLALLLARGGARVTLLDPRAPWEKPCGGGIPPRALERFPDAAGLVSAARSVRTLRLVSPRGAACRVELDRPLTIVSRREMGRGLLDAAREAGARLVRARATGLARGSRGWRVETLSGEHRGDVLVGADGVASLVRRRLSRRFDPADLTMAVGYWLPRPVPEDQVVVGFAAGAAGYHWVFPRTDHAAAGTGDRLGAVPGRELFARLDRFLQDLPGRPAPDPRRRYAACIPSLDAEALRRNRVAGPDWALVGDAAGWADPLTGEGIYYALASARLLAEALGRGGPPDYARMCRREIVPELERAAGYARTFFRTAVTERLVALCREDPCIRSILADLVAGVQDYGGLRRRLLAAVPGIARDLIFTVFQGPEPRARA